MIPYHFEVEIYKSCDPGIDHVSSLYIWEVFLTDPWHILEKITNFIWSGYFDIFILFILYKEIDWTTLIYTICRFTCQSIETK